MIAKKMLTILGVGVASAAVASLATTVVCKNGTKIKKTFFRKKDKASEESK